MTKTERIEQIIKKLKTRKSKNIIYTIIVSLIVLVFGLRFYAVSQENNFDVFNIDRNNLEHGLYVDVLEMEKTDGVLLEPLTIKNNRGFVSGARLKNFKSGQKIGNCKVISVSQNIDLDTGMHIVKTSGCADGLQYVEIKAKGFYVPVSAVHGNVVYIVDNGVARIREIIIENQDSQNALIKSGLNIGDIVILSDVQDNQKIKIAE
jgi:hypothetical protein